MESLELVKNDINELKVIVAKQEMNLNNLTRIMDDMKDDLKTHIKRSDTLEDLFGLLKEEQIRLREEHNLAKHLLISKIEQEQTKAEVKSETIWTVLKTVFYTLAAVGTVILALEQLKILDKLF